jgi:hypothetical protein
MQRQDGLGAYFICIHKSCDDCVMVTGESGMEKGRGEKNHGWESSREGKALRGRF